MTRFSTLAALVVLALCYSGLAAVASADMHTAEAYDPGKEAYEKNCGECHGVEVADITPTTKVDADRGPDLTGLSERYESDWLSKYVMQEAEIEGKSHKKKFKGSDEELQVLVDWLLEQKAEDYDE